MPRNATLGNFGFNSAKGLRRVEPYPRSEKVTWNWASLGFIRLAVNSPPTISPSLDKFYFACSKLFKIFLFCPYFMLDRFKCFLWKHMRAYWTSGFIHLGTALPPHNRIQSANIVVSNWKIYVWMDVNGQNMTSMKRYSKYDVDEEGLKIWRRWRGTENAGKLSAWHSWHRGQVLGHLAAWHRCLGGGGGCRKV